MTTYPKLHMIIDGEHIHAQHRRTHKVVNPATEEVLGELPLADAADLDRALETAAQGLPHLARFNAATARCRTDRARRA